MPKIIIKDIPGLDGEYDLDMTFTYRDFRTIKQVAGVRANEMMDALNAGDLDIVIALAEIALRRAEVPHTIDMLLDADAGGVTLDTADVEEDAGPPPVEKKSGVEKPSSGSDTNGATEPSQESLTDASSGTRLPVST